MEINLQGFKINVFISQLVNSEDCDDTTALHYAVEARNLDLVKELVKTGITTTTTTTTTTTVEAGTE